MRDHTSGQKWNAKFIRVPCRGCNHSNLRYPIDLKRYADRTMPGYFWSPIHVVSRGERDAIAEAHPLPR